MLISLIMIKYQIFVIIDLCSTYVSLCVFLRQLVSLGDFAQNPLSAWHMFVTHP